MRNEHYKQVKISVDIAIASAFKESCAASNTSMAAMLSQFMANFSNTAMSKKPSPDYSTRKRRRAAIQTIVKQLEQIRDREEQYRDNIPENLRGSSTYDSADEFVSILDEAVDLLAPV